MKCSIGVDTGQDYFAGIMREMKRFLMIALVTLAVMLAGCSAAAPTTMPTGAAGVVELTRYATITLTPTVTATPVNAPTATLAPTQTPTPRVYSVKDNDTMFVIAFRNGLTLDELQKANPDVDPYTLSAGMTLKIPAPSNVSATAQAPTPTPAAMTIGPVQCLATSTGGTYCFALVTNAQAFDLGSISAEFRLSNPLNGEVLTQPATLPVSRLTAGSAVPFFAYFAPPVFAAPVAFLQLQTAIQAGDTSARPAVAIDSPLVQIAEGGLSAVVNGAVTLGADSVPASTAWMTAAAFDASGSLIGIRRIELTGEIKAGGTSPFTLTLYSLSGKIDKVELYVDAIP